ncbi:MAG: RHS repeat-associated core domain-containing protein, partial [Fibrobacter sp.]|nr:RHS repeat-associated core domain-containing protein [Fibrobacter sp.]
TWWTELVTHYTGIGTEIRENPVNHEAKVVMNMPNGLGRYEPEDAAVLPSSSTSRTFEWYLKNHLGSTMLVYASGYGTPGVVRAAYDYRAFGEQVTLTESADKVTENFTGKEKDDETELNYFGARYLDPMLGMWTSVDPARQFASPYLYAGNGVNPIGGLDPSGTYFMDEDGNKTEGEFVAPEFQGMVSPDELIELQYAIEKFMESPGNVETLYSMAKYTLNHDVETRYWYDSKGQNNFAFGKSSCVLAGLGSGLYIHVHNWRPWSDMGSEGLSPSDVDWSNSNGSMMAYEIRSGHVYYTNISLPKQYRIMTIPMGGVLDATEFKGPMQDARPLESCETKEIK